MSSRYLFVPCNNAIRGNPKQPGRFPGKYNQAVLGDAHAAATKFKNQGFSIIGIENQGGVPKYKTFADMVEEFKILLAMSPWMDQILICHDYGDAFLDGRRVEKQGLYATCIYRDDVGVEVACGIYNRRIDISKATFRFKKVIAEFNKNTWLGSDTPSNLNAGNLIVPGVDPSFKDFGFQPLDELGLEIATGFRKPCHGLIQLALEGFWGGEIKSERKASPEDCLGVHSMHPDEEALKRAGIYGMSREEFLSIA